jgi:TolB protein
MARIFARSTGRLVATAVFTALFSTVAFAQPLPVPGGDGRGGQPAIPNQTTVNPADTPAVDESGGLYVVVEASSRPMDALYVVAPVCGAPKSSPELKTACDLLENVLANDARLSGFVRPIRHNAGLAAQVIKAPMPAFAVKPGGPGAANLQYVIATAVKPAKQAGMLDVSASLYDVRAGKLVDLGDHASQIIPATTVRQAAHRLMNAVQGAVTGIEGTFDTVVYYSAPAPGCNRAIWQCDVDGFNRRVLIGDGGKDGIHMFPVQLQDSALAYMSFRSGLPSLYKLDLAQVMVMSDMTPVVKNVKLKKGQQMKGTAPDDALPIPVPFASGPDLQFHSCAQNARGDLVVTVNDGDQSDIYTLDYTGHLDRNLTHDEHDELGPTFSPDGEHLAFVSDRIGTPQIYVMDALGGNTKRLSWVGPYNTDPDWGPDGRIAFSALRQNAVDIMTVTIDGKLQRLTPGQGRRSLEPSWSPDGKRLIYVSNEDGKCSRLWVTAADGASREPLDVPCGQYYTPSWQRTPGKGPKIWNPRH